jgi:hypothetical protein
MVEKSWYWADSSLVGVYAPDYLNTDAIAMACRLVQLAVRKSAVVPSLVGCRPGA